MPFPVGSLAARLKGNVRPPMHFVLVLVILVLTAFSSVIASESQTMTYGVCKLFAANEAEPDEAQDWSVNTLHPITYLMKMLSKEMQEMLSLPSGAHVPQKAVDWLEKTDSFKKTALLLPRHGNFVNMKNNPYDEYLPQRGYVGNDRIDLLIEGEDDLGHPISMTIRYSINVLAKQEFADAIVDNQTYAKATKKYCGKTEESSRLKGPTTKARLKGPHD